MTGPVFVELNDDLQKMEVQFPFSKEAAGLIKSINGGKFIPPDRGGPLWRFPLDLTTARRLREAFGRNLRLGPNVSRWAKKAVHEEEELRALSVQPDASLEGAATLTLPDGTPLNEWLRPYQRAGIKFMAERSCINADDPGLGKTIQTIAAIYEAGLEDRCHLVLCPKTSINNVWIPEIHMVAPDMKCFPWHGDLKKSEQNAIVDGIHECIEGDEPFWLVTTPQAMKNGNMPVACDEWGSITLDEYHKMGLGNTKTGFYSKVNELRAERKWALSGTPIGGKPIRLWGALHWLHPGQFGSKWRWAAQWLEVTTNGFGQEIGGIKKGYDDEFYAELAPNMVRRLKGEVLKELPPKQYIEVWCDMTPKQKKAYETFAREAEITIEGKSLTGAGVLAEYARCKQFAGAMCRIDYEDKVCRGCHGEGIDDYSSLECDLCEGTGRREVPNLYPLPDSGKLNALMEHLDELGIEPGTRHPDGKVAIVASQSEKMISMVAEYLNSKGIETELITGKVKEKDRKRIVSEFQKGTGPQVVALTTTAGGVSITLDRADTVHVLDETWNPDDQLQLEDRAHRGSRIHQVTIYYYRSNDTIEEDIAEVTKTKRITNHNILDLRRQGLLRAYH